MNLKDCVPRNLPRFVLALAIGSLGGYLFNKLSMPLAWMLGSMSACTAAAVVRLPIAALQEARPVMTAVIGVLLGSGFTTGIFLQLGDMIVSIAFMSAYLALSAIIGTVYFIRIARFDRVTAFFAAMPGGLIEMTTMGGEKGGSEKLIALIHSARIFFVVASLPYLLMLSSEEITGSTVGTIDSTAEIFDPSSLVWIAACGVLGAFVGRWLKLPARFLLGPMLLSAAIHVSGISDFQIPYQIIIVAQVMLGTLIGCRFVGTPPAEILRILLLSVLLILVLLAVLVLIVELGEYLGVGDPKQLLLAYAPGGMTEMSLVALSVNADVAFVSVHHIARIALVLILASLASRWLAGYLSRQK